MFSLRSYRSIQLFTVLGIVLAMTVYLSAEEPLSQYAEDLQQVHACLKDKNYAQASLMIDELFVKHSAEPDFVKQLWGLACGSTRTAKQYDLEQSIYDRLLIHFSEHELVMRILSSKAEVCLIKEDYPQASSIIDELFVTHSAEADFVNQLCRLARGRVRVAKQYELEQSIYDRLLEQFPGHALTVQVLVDKSAGFLVKGDFALASSTVDELFAKHSDNQILVNQLWRLACGSTRAAKQYDLEQSIYDRLLMQFPDHELVSRILSSKAELYLIKGDVSQADTTVEQFKQSCEGRADMSIYDTICHLAYRYELRGHLEKSRALRKWLAFRYLNETPEALKTRTGRTLWSMSYIVVETARGGDPETAMQVIDKLIAQGLIKADQQPLWDVIRARVNVHQYRDADADAAVGDVLKGIDKISYALSEQVFGVGEDYFVRAQEAEKAGNQEKARMSYQKAIAFWDTNIINRAADPHYQHRALYLSAFSYERMNEHEMARSIFQLVVDRWPSHEKAWDAQFMVAKMYRELEKTGAMSSSEARGEIVKACRKVIEQYPDCPAAPAARKLLATYSQE